MSEVNEGEPALIVDLRVSRTQLHLVLEEWARRHVKFAADEAAVVEFDLAEDPGQPGRWMARGASICLRVVGKPIIKQLERVP